LFFLQQAFHHCGLREAWHSSAYSNIEARELSSGSTSKCINCSLPACVIRLSDPAAFTHCRGYIDDNPASLKHHWLQCSLRAIEHSTKINIHHLLPIFRLHLEY